MNSGNSSALGNGGVRGGAEDAPQRGGVDVGTDAEAEAADAAATRLDEGTPRVGLAVATLVAVVVREAVGEHDQQAARRAAAFIEDRRAVSDGRTEPRVRGGNEAGESSRHLAGRGGRRTP